MRLMGVFKKISTIVLSLVLAFGLVLSVPTNAYAASKPGTVKISSVSVSKNTATVKWAKVKNAKKYEVKIVGSKTVTKTVSGTSYKYTGSSNEKIKVTVRGVNGKTKGSWSAAKSATLGVSDADTIKALKAENDKLAKENSKLKADNEKLKSDNKDLEDRVSELEKLVASLKESVKELQAKLDALLSPEESPIVGTWFYDTYKNGHMMNTEYYKLKADGSVIDDNGKVGTYTFENNVVTVSVNGKTLTFDYDADNNVLTRSGRTYQKSLPISSSLAGEWYLQGEGVWAIMHMSEDGEFYFEYSDVPDSPVYVAHMVDEDTIAILANEYDIEGTILQQVELHHNYYARYTNLYRMWKCAELANPDNDYDGIIWVTENGRGTEWTVEDDKYLCINGEKFTINNENETLSIVKNGHTYVYEVWHDPNVQ